jgi:hypothetical protein
VNGNLIWTREVGASGGTTIGSGITVDSTFDKNVYITGRTNRAISGQTQSGDVDSFVTKYTSDGDLVNTIQFGAPGGTTTQGFSIVANSICNCLYVTGSTNTLIFGSQNNGIVDYFLAKYDYSLNLAWGTQVGALDGYSVGTGVDADAIGNGYITGYTTVGISGQTQIGDENYFIAKYNSDGALQWGYQAGGVGGVTNGFGIATTPLGDSYITGISSVGVMGQSLVGNTDYFVVSYVDQ